MEWQDATTSKPDDGEEVLIEDDVEERFLGIYNSKTTTWEDTTLSQPIAAKWWTYIPPTPESKTG